MTRTPDLPSRAETGFAYATAVVASLVWVACVVPGVALADPSLPDDLATPMHRGAMLLVPALLLLVAMPVAAVIARHALGLRGLLAWSDAFVTLYTAAVLASHRPRGVVFVAAAALAVLAAVSVRDALRIGRAAAREPLEDVPPSHADLRSALSVLALLAPASLLALGTDERASWLAPFAYVAVSAIGERYARSLAALRRTTALCLLVLAAHLAVSVRFALTEGHPPAADWTLAGRLALGLSAVVGLTALAWGRATLASAPAEAAA